MAVMWTWGFGARKIIVACDGNDLGGRADDILEYKSMEIFQKMSEPHCLTCWCEDDEECWDIGCNYEDCYPGGCL